MSSILNLDFSTTSLKRIPIPVGIYEAIVEKVEQKVSRKGNEMVLWTFLLTHDGFEGRRAFKNSMLMESARFYLMRDLVAIGYTEEEVQQGQTLDMEDWIDRPCAVVMVAGEYDGKPTSNVDRILPIEEATGPVNEEDGDYDNLFGN